MIPRYPVYIVSRKRYTDKLRLTATALDKMGVPYTMIVEGDELDLYREALGDRVLAVPEKYHAEYDTCDNLGQTKSQGPGPARNYAWDLAMAGGYNRHWVMDDNISKFYRLNYNKYIEVGDGSILRAMEDFTDRFTNVAMAGPDYSIFSPRKQKTPPITINTRLYSCILLKNDIPFRWRARYNEDTDLSLRVLKAGWCTVEFNAFTQGKAPTQTVRGGNMDEFYIREGTLPKTQMQVLLHPDCSKLVWKFHRWHHEVDYSRFKANKLIPRADIKVPKGTDNYGMELISLKRD